MVPGNRVKLIRTNGWLYCWGFNTHSQLGLGYTYPNDVLKPQSQGGAWRSVTAGHHHTCGISQEGRFPYCWGDNDFGQLGIGNTSRKLLPARVAS